MECQQTVFTVAYIETEVTNIPCFSYICRVKKPLKYRISNYNIFIYFYIRHVMTVSEKVLS